MRTLSLCSLLAIACGPLDDDFGEARQAEVARDAGPRRADAGSNSPDAGSPRLLVPAPPSACGTGGLKTSRCFRATVACPGIAPLDVAIKVTDPTGPVRGTIVFGSGSGGTTFYDASAGPTVTELLAPLVAQGYRVVQRKWAGAQGWLTGPGGSKALACRYATLARAIRAELYDAGGYCVSGNSGGSSEVAYGLAHYGLGDIVDLAVPTSGPPMGRVDLGCASPAQAPGWSTACKPLLTCATGTCSYGPAAALLDASYASPVCSNHSAAMSSTFYSDSVLSPGAVLDYPQTHVVFLYGDRDCTEAVPLGRVYANAVTSVARTRIVAGAPHPLPSVSAGAKALFNELSADCVLRH